jgi:hypothetical protein
MKDKLLLGEGLGVVVVTLSHGFILHPLHFILLPLLFISLPQSLLQLFDLRLAREEATPRTGASSSSSSASTPIQIHLMTTLRSGPAPAGNPRKAVILSALWPRMVIGHTTTPADITPSGDQGRPTLEHRVAAWSGT